MKVHFSSILNFSLFKLDLCLDSYIENAWRPLTFRLSKLCAPHRNTAGTSWSQTRLTLVWPHTHAPQPLTRVGSFLYINLYIYSEAGRAVASSPPYSQYSISQVLFSFMENRNVVRVLVCVTINITVS